MIRQPPACLTESIELFRHRQRGILRTASKRKVDHGPADIPPLDAKEHVLAPSTPGNGNDCLAIEWMPWSDFSFQLVLKRSPDFVGQYLPSLRQRFRLPTLVRPRIPGRILVNDAKSQPAAWFLGQVREPRLPGKGADVQGFLFRI
jgi:hypothetical protein